MKLYRFESKLDDDNHGLMQVMNDNTEFYNTPDHSEHYTHGHSRTSLYEDAEEDKSIYFFYSSRNDKFIKTKIDLRERGFILDYNCFIYDWNTIGDEAELVYEDDWQIALKFKNPKYYHEKKIKF